MQRLHEGGKGGGGGDTDHFERMQIIEERQIVQVTVFQRSTDFTVCLIVFSYFIVIQN